MAWLLTVGWAGVIFFMSGQSDIDSGIGIISAIKRWLTSVLSNLAGQTVDISLLGHFFEYLVLGILIANALRYYVLVGKVVFGTIGIGSFYAFTDELHQYFVPGRVCDPLDCVVDVLAVVLAACASLSALRRS